MNKLLLSAIFLGCSAISFPALADDPAPAGAGIEEDGPQVVQADADKKAPEGNPPGQSKAADETDLQKQMALKEIENKALTESLKQVKEAQKELEQLRSRLATLEGENTALSTRIKSLEEENTKLANRVKRLEGDNAALLEWKEEAVDKLASGEADGSKTQVTARPGFVKSAVVFHNHEGRSLRMNVNGVWHTLKEGLNEIWVPYGPVYIYRYNGAEPKPFYDWKTYKDGYVMEFDVGTPASGQQ